MSNQQDGGQWRPEANQATVNCPHCGASNQAGARFCKRCGTALAPAPTVVVPPAAPPIPPTIPAGPPPQPGVAAQQAPAAPAGRSRTIALVVAGVLALLAVLCAGTAFAGWTYYRLSGTAIASEQTPTALRPDATAEARAQTATAAAQAEQEEDAATATAAAEQATDEAYQRNETATAEAAASEMAATDEAFQQGQALTAEAQAARQTAQQAAVLTALAAPTATIPEPTATLTPEPPPTPVPQPTPVAKRLRFVKLNENERPGCISVKITGIGTGGWFFRIDGTRLQGNFDGAGNAAMCGLAPYQEVTLSVYNRAGQFVPGGRGVPTRGNAIMQAAWR